jgi:hypothetical protein
MKARIEKKLSKKIALLAPDEFEGAWIDKGPSELAYEQQSRVKNLLRMGGGTDYWGEGEGDYSAWDWFKQGWHWYGHFKPYPEGHRFAGNPNTKGFKPTTINLIKLAKG